MRRTHMVLFMLFAPLFLFGGTCGSVIRGQVPAWSTGSGGNWVHTFGDIQVEVGALVRREGVSFMNTTITNRGSVVVRVTGAVLESGSTHNTWKTTDIDIAPGASTPFRIEFSAVPAESRSLVVIQLSTGDLRVELSEP